MEYVVFKLNGENYTIPLEKIKEILVYSQVIITELFAEEAWIRGLINLRGEVIPIVDLRALFHISDTSISDNTVIIVTRTEEDKLIGIIVDNIESILDLDRQTIVSAPDMGVSIDPKYIDGLIKLNDEQMTILLNIDTVLKIEETA
ncbi:MAG: chemotaxis protein CheW [Sulfurospirillum sp.]|nr:MAG: chemotaxis protein CheW [Sulfurospirillum sp.]